MKVEIKQNEQLQKTMVVSEVTVEEMLSFAHAFPKDQSSNLAFQVTSTDDTLTFIFPTANYHTTMDLIVQMLNYSKEKLEKGDASSRKHITKLMGVINNTSINLKLENFERLCDNLRKNYKEANDFLSKHKEHYLELEEEIKAIRESERLELIANEHQQDYWTMYNKLGLITVKCFLQKYEIEDLVSSHDKATENLNQVKINREELNAGRLLTTWRKGMIKENMDRFLEIDNSRKGQIQRNDHIISDNIKAIKSNLGINFTSCYDDIKLDDIDHLIAMNTQNLYDPIKEIENAVLYPMELAGDLELNASFEI